MKFDIKNFKKNALFFMISILSLIVLLLLSFLNTNSSNKLKKVELTDDKTNVNKLIINEIMSSNKGAIAEEDGRIYDYVEIYNGSNKDIDLKNYGLSDEEKSVKWTFPDVTIESKKYLIIYLCGQKHEGLYAPFKLKSGGGEVVALFKPNGKIVDAVKTVALEGNTVMARDSKGSWVIQMQPTPGYENSINGHKDFLASLISSEESSIKINEILPNNKGNFKNSYGEYSGYIEIINEGNKTVNVANYSLSNNEDDSFKWQLPSVNLSGGEVLLIYTSGVNKKDGELSASFKLKNDNGEAVLTNSKGKVIDIVKYENLGSGMAYIKQEGKFLESNIISPGYKNTLDGIKSFQKKYLKNPEDLMINEVMNSNSKYLTQNAGNHYDWIELYNNSNKTVNLSDYCFSTNTVTMCRYKLPDIKLESGKYYVIMTSGEESLSNKSYKHANFKLSDTQSLYLTKDKKIIDSIFMANIPNNYSYGRGSSYGEYFYSNPTPKEKNGSGSQAISYVPYASVETGTYNNTKKFKVELTGSGKIYYTTDGREPTTSSKVYSSPLTIKKTTVLRIMSKESGKVRSAVKTYSYIVNENHSLPVMSLALNPNDLNSLHYNAWNEGYQKKVYAQLIETDGSGFEISAGLKLFGGSTRGHAKKSYELKFQKTYGEGKLNYQVFDDVDSAVFDSIVLRSGSQDEMGDASKKTLIRDIVGTSLLSDYTSVDVQAYKPVALYINGKYWGLYFIREKVDETFVANHYNIESDKRKTDVLRIDGQVKSGNRNAYNNMVNFIENNSMSKKANYKKITEQINIENFCDFWIAEIYTANNDIVNVRYFRNPKIDGGKWHFIFYDLDFAFYNVNKNYFQFATSSSGMTSVGYSTVLLRNLMKSSEFRKTFLERLQYNLTNTWDEDVVVKRIDDVVKEIGKDEIKRNLNRWGLSYSTWQNSIKNLKNYAKKRNDYIVSQAKSYFNLSSKETKKYFGEVQ